jgi:hypothetical protein
MSIRQLRTAPAGYDESSHSEILSPETASLYVQECVEQPDCAQNSQAGNVLAVFQSIIRCTANAFLRLHDQRNQWADKTDLERFFSRNSHIANDIGLTPERRFPQHFSK